MSKSNPIVGIIMGSDSDLPVMSGAVAVLEQFGIEYEVLIVSAHRTPDYMFTYSKTASERGLQIIIAGAGGSAHLPGMCASLTSLPVIGVPVQSKNMDGIDSLLSIVQMPPGVPVATVGIGDAQSAGILAVEMLALSRDALTTQLKQYKKLPN
ncbi:MAG: 5-(carboxyamino)imidazole ribonucleotide mutase [bacterium]